MKTVDILGVGVGPFNLSLAALSQPIASLSTLFVDDSPRFDWHPGMMLGDAHLQVPFMADLVSMADPTSPYSFLNFLKQTGRLYPFYIRENFYPLRREYNAYCQWAAVQLPSVRFGARVLALREHDGGYVARIESVGERSGASIEEVFARNVVLGTGTSPWVPACARGLVYGPRAIPAAIHSSAYLDQKARLQAQPSITIVGSGQSAAEIYYDLLRESDAHGYELNWVTRSPRFSPLEYTKLTLEMTSPDYIDYFHALPQTRRAALGADQKMLYKGIDSELINAIYDLLYERSVHGGAVRGGAAHDGATPPDKVPAPRTRILSEAELIAAAPQAPRAHATNSASGGPWSGGVELTFANTVTGERFALGSGAVVFATGYRYREPELLAGLGARVLRQADGQLAVDRNYAIACNPRNLFVQNAELHTHGFTAPDLGMGAHRSSIILNEITGRTIYPVEERIAFQEFGVPEDLKLPGGGADTEPMPVHQDPREPQAAHPRQGDTTYV